MARKRALREEEEGERGEQERRGPAPSMGGRHGRRAAARMTRCWRSFARALLLLPLTSTAVGTPWGSGQPREPGDANGSERVALFLRGASTNEKVLRRAAQTRRVRPGSCAGW